MLSFVKAALVKLPSELRLSSGMISLCAPLIQAAGWSFVNPIRAESVWETMSERVSEKEREKEGGGCVLKQGISVFQLLSGWFPERAILSLSLFAHIDQAQTFFSSLKYDTFTHGVIQNAFHFSFLLPFYLL